MKSNIELSVLVLGRDTHKIIQAALPSNIKLNVTRILNPTRFEPITVSDLVGIPGDLDCETQNFDFVIACGWHEVSSWMRWSLQEVHRVLKNEGQFLLLLPVVGKNICGQSEGHHFNVAGNRLRSFLGRRPYHHKFGEFEPVLTELGLIIDNQQRVTATRVFPAQNRLKIRGKLIDVPWIGVKEYILLSGTKSSSSWKANKSLQNKEVTFSIIDRDYGYQKKTLEKFIVDYKIAISKPKEFAQICGDAKTALIISPHPDDELIGAGAATNCLAKNGTQVTALQLTNGRNCRSLFGQLEPVRSTIRLREAQKVAERIGAVHMHAEGFDDNISKNDIMTQSDNVAKLMKKLNPDLVFVPALNDPHPDHKATNNILRNALVESKKNPLVLQYEVWSFCPANVFLIFDEFGDTKTDIMGEYRTALRTVNYTRVSQLHAAWHSFKIRNKPGQVEAFFYMESQAYVALHDKVMRGNL